MAKYQVGASTYEVPDGIPQEQLTSILTELATREQAASSAKKEMAPAPKQSGSLLKTIDDAVRGAADTVTFGYSDEIAAGLDKLFGVNTSGKDVAPNASYDERLAAQRSRDAEGGTARTVGQVAGGLIPLAKGAQLAKAGLLKAGITPTAAKVGAITGGTSAGLYGTGSAEGDIGDRLVEGAMAVPVGATIGAVAPAVVNKIGQAGGAVIDKVKDIAGVPIPVSKLSAEAQALVKSQSPDVTEVSSKAAKALEKLSENPNSVASDIRVRELFLSEKARALATDPQRAIPDDEIFKNVGDKLKQTAVTTVEALRKSGEIDAEAAKEAKLIVSRAARHNRAITGEIVDEELAKELAHGFRTDDAIIDALNIGNKAKDAIKAAVKDLDTVTFNAMKKNQGGIFEAAGSMAGKLVGSPAGTAGSIVGKNVGGTAGRLVDKVLLQQGTAPVLKRSAERIAQGLDEAGIAAGDTVGDLTAVGKESIKKAAEKALAEQKAAAALKAQDLGVRNQVLQETRMPLSGAFQELLPGGRANTNLSSDEAIQALRLLARKGGVVGEGAKKILKSPTENLPDAVFYGVQNKLLKLQEKGLIGGTPPVKNQAAYNAKVIENTLRDILKKGE